MTKIRSSRNGLNEIQIIEVHNNIDQELIQITEDRLRLILKEYFDEFFLANGWISPTGILISIITTFCTSKFDTFLGLGPDFWRAIFVLVGIASLIWLIFSLIRGSKAMTLDELIIKVKNKS